MEKIDLTAFKRENLTKSNLKKLRNNGFIPAVVYGYDENIPIYVKRTDFYRIFRKYKKAIMGAIIQLNICNTTFSKPTIIKEIQRAHTSDDIIHIDFQVISLKEKIEVMVPIEVIGEAKGIVEVLAKEIKLKCFPSKIPEKITVDISSLNIGESIMVKDLKIPTNAEFITSPETILITITSPVEEEVSMPIPTHMEPEVISKGKKKEEAEEESE